MMKTRMSMKNHNEKKKVTRRRERPRKGKMIEARK